MTRTIDAENEQKEILEKLLIEFEYFGEKETLRPEALHIRGVDNLSTEDTKAFVDYYLNWEEVEEGNYKELEDPRWFRIQWIDDTSLNVVFKTHEDSLAALKALCPIEDEDSPDIYSPEHLEFIIKEREAKSYNATLPFNKYQKALKKEFEDQDLFADKASKTENEEETNMDEDSSAVVLHIRQSFQSDRKTKNAAAYSRYYLFHGEPDRTERRRNERYTQRRNRNDRGNGRGRRGRGEDEEEDLFANKLRDTRRQTEEEDLFSWRMRERSPSRRE